MSQKEFSLTNEISQSNDLMVGVSKLSNVNLKIFEMAISCIDRNDKTFKKHRQVELSKKKIFDVLDVNSTAKYTRLVKSLNELNSTGIVVEIPDTDRVGLIPITSYIEYGTIDNDDKILIEFNERILPLIFDLKKSFTKYQVKEILQFKSAYSMKLYKYLIMNWNQYESYFRNNDKNTPIISVEELKKYLGVEKNSNKTFNHFKTNVLERAIKEINEKSNLFVSFKLIKHGKKVVKIQFFIFDNEEEFNNIEKTVDFIFSEKDFIKVITKELGYEIKPSDQFVLKFVYSKYAPLEIHSALRHFIIYQKEFDIDHFVVLLEKGSN